MSTSTLNTCVGSACAEEGLFQPKFSTCVGSTPRLGSLEVYLRSKVVDPKDINISFENFPYCISNETKSLLTSAARVHLEKRDDNLISTTPPSRTIMLLGSDERFQQSLVKDLALHYNAKLLMLDVEDFIIKMSNIYDFELFFNEAPETLSEVLVSVSNTSPTILYMGNIDHVLLKSEGLYDLFSKMLEKLKGRILVLGSRVMNRETEHEDTNDKLGSLFPACIDIKAPDDERDLQSWSAQLDKDEKLMNIAEAFAANDIFYDDLASICHADLITFSNHTDEVIRSALFYHLMDTSELELRDGKLVLSSYSLSHGLSEFQKQKHCTKAKMGNSGGKAVDDSAGSPNTSVSDNKTEMDKSLTKNEKNSAPVMEVPLDNKFENNIWSQVIRANETGLTFSDIGANDKIKEEFEELVLIPLRRPELYKDELLTPCKGILLFGPPGTGKTMLAKAIANEAGVSFINVSMSTITSKWYGEAEKNVRALFTIAAKIAPTIIFIDEVDSMLRKRSHSGEDETMRIIKNEFMTHWDGLNTKASEYILVLGATNRPFDLDDAVIRRFEHRIMVDLPDVESREKILRTILSKEKIENFDFRELANMTEGYSGSDLKVLCKTAKRQCVTEFLEKEREQDERKRRAPENKDSCDSSNEATEDKKNVLRPLNMEDLRKGKRKVAASIASEGTLMNELKEWNELYGEGGTRKKQQLSYFC